MTCTHCRHKIHWWSHYGFEVQADGFRSSTGMAIWRAAVGIRRKDGRLYYRRHDEGAEVSTDLRASTPREERALAFSLHEHMLAKLRENRGKRHWLECSPQFLIDRLHEEVEELEQALGGYLEEGSAEDSDVWREAADVGNFAAMLAENATGPIRIEDAALATDSSVGTPEPAPGPWKVLYEDYDAGTVFVTRDPTGTQSPMVEGLTIEQGTAIAAALNAA